MASASAAVRRKVCGGSLVVSFTCVSFATRRVRSVRWGRHGSARAAEKVGGWVFRRAGTTLLFAWFYSRQAGVVSGASYPKAVS